MEGLENSLVSYLVYLGLNKDGQFLYASLSTSDIHSETDKNIEEFKFHFYRKKLFKKQSLMSVHKINSFENLTLSYNSLSPVIAYWQNKQNREKYIALGASAEMFAKYEKSSKEKPYLKELDRARDLIRSVPRNQRNFLIGEILNYLLA